MGTKIRNKESTVRVAVIWEDFNVEVYTATKTSVGNAYWYLTNKRNEFAVKHDKNSNLPATQLILSDAEENQDALKIVSLVHLKTPELEKSIVPALTSAAKAFAAQRSALFKKVCSAFDMQVNVESE